MEGGRVGGMGHTQSTCLTFIIHYHRWGKSGCKDRGGGGGQRLYLYIVKIGNFTRVLMPFLITVGCDSKLSGATM